MVFEFIKNIICVVFLGVFLASIIQFKTEKSRKKENAQKLEQLLSLEFDISTKQLVALKMIDTMTDSRCPIYDFLNVLNTLGLLDEKGEQGEE